MNPLRINKILITGAYGTNNLGDEKILYGLTELCRQHYNAEEVIAASINPDSTMEQVSVDDATNNIDRDFIEWVNVIRTVDLIILGGGSVLGNVFARRHSLVVTIAKAFDIPIYVIAGAENKNEIDKRLSNAYLDLVDGIVVRDKASKRRIRKWGFSGSIDVVADPGFIPVRPTESSDFGIPNDRILISIRPMDHKATGVDKPGLSSALDLVNDKYDQELVFFPFHRETDLAFNKDIVRRMDTNAVLFDKDYTIEEAESIIGRSDAIVAMRLHSMILASHQRTPYLPIPYNPKCEAFLEEVSFTAEISYRDIEPEKFAQQLEKIITNREPIESSLDRIESLERECWDILSKCDQQQHNHSTMDVIQLASLIPMAIWKEFISGQGN